VRAKETESGCEVPGFVGVHPGREVAQITHADLPILPWHVDTDVSVDHENREDDLAAGIETP
jgi:hypothetical protein